MIKEQELNPNACSECGVEHEGEDSWKNDMWPESGRLICSGCYSKKVRELEYKLTTVPKEDLVRVYQEGMIALGAEPEEYIIPVK